MIGGGRAVVGGGRAAALALAALVVAAGCGPARPAPATPGRGATGRPARAAAAPGAVQHGLATWYATGTMTASGEPFDPRGLTTAHRTLPFNTIVRVTHRRTGKRVTVRINDRGPFGDRRRIIDVSKGAAERLGILREGVAPVAVEVVRTGDGRRYRARPAGRARGTGRR